MNFIGLEALWRVPESPLKKHIYLLNIFCYNKYILKYRLAIGWQSI